MTYLRFMTKGAARIATIVVICLCTAFHIAFLLVQVNLCQPVGHIPLLLLLSNTNYEHRQESNGIQLSPVVTAYPLSPVRNADVRTACETYTDFVNQHLVYTSVASLTIGFDVTVSVSSPFLSPSYLP
jgi:hypothetical protein